MRCTVLKWYIRSSQGDQDTRLTIREVYIRIDDQFHVSWSHYNTSVEYHLDIISNDIKRMPEPKRDNDRHYTFTRETADSLTRTLIGLVEISKHQLTDSNVKFILLGSSQSDCIEEEFGVYRQAFGGLFYITVEQVLSTAKGRRLKLPQALDVDEPTNHQAECCSKPWP